MRLRYFLAINVPLSKRGLVKGSWYGSAYNEIFVNTDRALFDRNRVYAGFGYRIADGLRMELGYMNQIFSSVLSSWWALDLLYLRLCLQHL